MNIHIKNLQNEFIKLKKLDRLVDKVNQLTNKNNVILNEDHTDLKNIISNEGNKILENSELSPFQKIFWKQQEESAMMENSQGMRWHPLMVRWCIYLRHQSQGAYETLRGCISLPSQRTLRDYTHHIKAAQGFSNEVDSQLCSAAGIDRIEEREKYVILLVDEMHVKEDLVYDKHTGEDVI